MGAYLKEQIITYMGNKRKFVPAIDSIISAVRAELKHELALGDGFSGSGIISRLFKMRGKRLYTNDLSGYSKTLNECYLSTPNEGIKSNVERLITKANSFASQPVADVPAWIQKHWAPRGEIKRGDRVYFTRENAVRIDRYRHFIEKLPQSYRPYLLAPLLVKCSIHNNTSGQFSAFYKADGVGKFGGKKSIDLKRITKRIELGSPIFSPHPCEAFISSMDTNLWARSIPQLDLVYYDPPYNKHPYSIYYFMLDIINNWDTTTDIPDTTRGQPRNWKRSPYNSLTNAKSALEDLIKHTNSRFILLSYNDGGIIPLDELEVMLERYGKITKVPVSHKTYNKFKGIASYKREKEWTDIKEFLWLIDCR